MAGRVVLGWSTPTTSAALAVCDTRGETPKLLHLTKGLDLGDEVSALAFRPTPTHATEGLVLAPKGHSKLDTLPLVLAPHGG